MTLFNFAFGDHAAGGKQRTDANRFALEPARQKREEDTADEHPKQDEAAAWCCMLQPCVASVAFIVPPS